MYLGLIIAIGFVTFALWEGFTAIWPRGIVPLVRSLVLIVLGTVAAQLGSNQPLIQDLVVGVGSAGAATLLNVIYWTILAYGNQKALDTSQFKRNIGRDDVRGVTRTPRRIPDLPS